MDSNVPQDIQSAVSRPLWEPRHEWEARVKFVEDYVTDWGLERAINLSLVWANMKYLGCSYPNGTEDLVTNYPVPTIEELKARRRCKNNETKHKSNSPVNFAEVSALLTSIHTQSSIKATHPQLQAIANEVCLCKDCLGLAEDESYFNKGLKILDHLKTSRENFMYEVSENTDEQGKTWSLVLNGEVVLKRNSTKVFALEDFVRMLKNWQESNQKPACPLVAQQSGSGSSSAQVSAAPQSHSDYYSSSVSSYTEQGYGGRQSGGYYQQDRNRGRGRGGWRGHNNY